jgi:hypothetical protein
VEGVVVVCDTPNPWTVVVEEMMVVCEIPTEVVVGLEDLCLDLLHVELLYLPVISVFGLKGP